MLWLYWFGQIFLQYLEPKKLLSIYILGGISGALLYIATFNLLPAFQGVISASYALGASAAVYAIVVAISAFVPDYSLGLLFIGRVKLKYIALFVVILDILSIPRGNAGGHIAHLGGAMYGYIFALRMKKGKDITKGFSSVMDYLVSLFKPSPKLKVSSNNFKTKQKPGSGPTYSKTASDLDFNKKKLDEQAEIDRILDKISKYGYDALSKEEKNTLFDQRKK
jgi:hypothetical protein